MNKGKTNKQKNPIGNKLIEIKGITIAFLYTIFVITRVLFILPIISIRMYAKMT